jgi:hypothetical protein
LPGRQTVVGSACTNKSGETPGAVTSKPTNFVNASCFTLPPIIGSDGLGAAFGNSLNGIVSGPDQRNFDISIIKKTPLTETKNVEFRAEFFNAFNTPSFSAGSQMNVGSHTRTPISPGCKFAWSLVI